jgi:hypothetical protein
VQCSSGLPPLKKYQFNQFVVVSVIDVCDSMIAALAGRWLRSPGFRRAKEKRSRESSALMASFANNHKLHTSQTALYAPP